MIVEGVEKMLQATIEQSLIFAIMVLGVYISFRILNFPDMTVDGTFPLGAAISAKLLTLGVNPYLTLLVALVAGAAAGADRAGIHRHQAWGGPRCAGACPRGHRGYGHPRQQKPERPAGRAGPLQGRPYPRAGGHGHCRPRH